MMKYTVKLVDNENKHITYNYEDSADMMADLERLFELDVEDTLKRVEIFRNFESPLVHDNAVYKMEL